MSLDRSGRVTATMCLTLALATTGCKSTNNANGVANTSNTMNQVTGLLQSLSHLQIPGTQPGGTAAPYQQQPYASPNGAQPYSGYQQASAPAQQQQQAQPQQSAAGAQAEAAFRQKLMMQSMGFGGIFGPGLKKWRDTPSAPSSGGGGGSGGSDECGYYNENAAKQACKNSDTWSADRIEHHEADPAEKDWYDR